MNAAASPAVGARPGVLPWLLAAALIVVADQLSKAWILQAFRLGEALYVTDFFNLVRVHNAGAAFSFLAGASGWQRWFFTVFALVASAVITWLIVRHRGERLFCTGLSLILGGAIGNVIDRIRFGYVVDFLDVHWRGWHFPSFNVADAAISVGAALIILDEIRRWRAPR